CLPGEASQLKGQLIHPLSERFNLAFRGSHPVLGCATPVLSRSEVSGREYVGTRQRAPPSVEVERRKSFRTLQGTESHSARRPGGSPERPDRSSPPAPTALRTPPGGGHRPRRCCR